MSIIPKPLLAAAPLVLLAACVQAEATMLVPGPHPMVAETEVQVFLKEDEVPASCQRIAIINTSGDADMTSEGQMITAARRRAGKIGANGVLLGETRDPGTGTRVAAVLLGTPKNRKSAMLAYRCPTNGAAPAAAATPAPSNR